MTKKELLLRETPWPSETAGVIPSAENFQAAFHLVAQWPADMSFPQNYQTRHSAGSFLSDDTDESLPIFSRPYDSTPSIDFMDLIQQSAESFGCFVAGVKLQGSEYLRKSLINFCIKVLIAQNAPCSTAETVFRYRLSKEDLQSYFLKDAAFWPAEELVRLLATCIFCQLNLDISQMTYVFNQLTRVKDISGSGLPAITTSEHCKNVIKKGERSVPACQSPKKLIPQLDLTSCLPPLDGYGLLHAPALDHHDSEVPQSPFQSQSISSLGGFIFAAYALRALESFPCDFHTAAVSLTMVSKLRENAPKAKDFGGYAGAWLFELAFERLRRAHRRREEEHEDCKAEAILQLCPSVGRRKDETLLVRLGAGGESTIFSASDKMSLDTIYAVKCYPLPSLRGQNAGSPQCCAAWTARLECALREYFMTRKLSSSYVCKARESPSLLTRRTGTGAAAEIRIRRPLYDCSLDEWRGFALAAAAGRHEYLQGGLRMLLKVCGCVYHLIEKNVVHGDIKMSNVLIRWVDFEDGLRTKVADPCNPDKISASQVVLSDFGNAHPPGTRPGSGSSCGITPIEIISTNSSVLTTDVWGLGVLLYELVTGSTPMETYADCDPRPHKRNFDDFNELSSELLDADSHIICIASSMLTQQAGALFIRELQYLHKDIVLHLCQAVQLSLVADPFKRDLSQFEEKVQRAHNLLGHCKKAEAGVNW